MPENLPADGLRWVLQIRPESIDGVRVLMMAGRISAQNSADLAAAIIAETASDEPRLVIDLARVDYISSAGLLELVRAAARLRERGGALALGPVSSPVVIAIRLADLERELSVGASREAALLRVQAFSAPSRTPSFPA
jgi:anti-anti-sigma factor